MANISAIKLPSGTTYNVKDKNALPLTGGQVTGPVTFGDTVSIDEATVGDLVVNGSASFTNNIQANTISGDLTGDVTGNVVGNVSGNATSATKATQDGSGNTITSYYCTLSTAQTISGVKTFSSIPMANVGICVNNGSGTAGGVSLWNDKNVNNYGLALRQTSNSGVHGYVQGSYAIYNYITAGTASESYTRGWVFRDTAHATNVASISGAGNAVFNGSVTVGGNTGNTSGCEMVFDSTTESVLMSFH